MNYYLAHPKKSQELVREWQQSVEARFVKCKFFNPFYTNDSMINVDELLDSESPVDIVYKDLTLINCCDRLVAIIDSNIKYGTIFEIKHAYDMGMPITAIVLNGDENHPWLRYYCDTILTSYESFEKKIIIEGMLK